jgi:hypothetical protein
MPHIPLFLNPENDLNMNLTAFDVQKLSAERHYARRSRSYRLGAIRWATKAQLLRHRPTCS